MPNGTDNISKVENDTQELVIKLLQLNEQIGSYGEAKKSLQETSQKIESLIEAMRDLTKESSTIIAKFDEISGVSLIQQMENIEEKLGVINGALETNQDSIYEANAKLGRINDFLDRTRKKSRLRFLFACGVFVLIISIQMIKIFIIDGISISEILTKLRNLI
jgi:DNA repair exonuclease SbcCD ATPase subunit